MIIRSFLLSLLLMSVSVVIAAPKISIITDSDLGENANHGLNKLTETLLSKQIEFEKVASISEAQAPEILLIGKSTGNGQVAQLLKSENHNVPQMSEALTIRKVSKANQTLYIIGGYDSKGIMYGLLDVASRISWSDDSSKPMQFVKEITSQPNIKERGIAMYTMHRRYWESRFYDENFWIRYFDMMSQNRLNMLEILFGYENGGWMAPCYPYFFNVEGYPDVKMQDITAEQQLRNVNTMNHIIDLAHERGIGIRLGIWDHIYRGGVQAGGNPDFEYDPNHALPWQVTGLDSTNLNDYTKVAFAKFLKTFPTLDAILFKTNNESGLKTSELHEFSLNFFKTVKETAPDMMIDIHSKGITDVLIQSAIDMGLKFKIAPKFWMEQLGLPFSPTHVNKQDQKNRRHGYADMLRYPQHYQMLWKLWNGGTNRAWLWGDSEYVRRFAESCQLYNSSAFAVYEPMATKMESQPHDMEPFELLNPPYQYYDYEFERYWYFFQLYGQIGYDLNVSSDIWDKEFEKRFGATTGATVQSALNMASWALPRIIAACYPYSFFPTTSAWPEKQRLGDLPLYATAEGSDIQQFASYDEEAQVLLGLLETAKTLPSTTSLWLEQLSKDIQQKISEAQKTIGTQENKEFNSTMVDLNMISNLALYHSRRIPAAISYCLFLRTQDIKALDAAIAHEQHAIEAWKEIVNAAGDVYAEKILIGNRALSGHWKDELGFLQRGLEKLKEQKAAFEPKENVTTAPLYKVATRTENSQLFTVDYHQISPISQNQPITIKIKVTAHSGLEWVRLQYRAVNQYKDFEMIPMTPTGEKDVFQATINLEKIDLQYDLMFLIELMDRKGNGFIYPDFNKETPYIIVPLTELRTEKNNLTQACNDCDSLHNHICPSNFEELDSPPQFPGGDKALMEFIRENLRWPIGYAEMSTQGRVIVRFIISETGEIICPRILRSLDPAMDKEALRIVGLMPNFIPASNNGTPIKVCYTLPVLFKLSY